MTFLNPAYLWLLPLMGVPVLLHFINRRTPKHIVFSAIQELKKADRSLMPKKRLRELLLMLLRMLFILCLVFLFSRPVLQSGAFLDRKGEKSSLVILLDVSASMGIVTGGREALAVAKDQVQALLRKLSKDTRVGFTAYSDRIESEVAPTKEHTRVSAAINGLSVRPRPTNVLPAVELASKMLANQPSGQKSILVVSDQAENGWRPLRLKEGHYAGYDPDIAVILWEVVGPDQNLGVMEASLQLSEEGILKGRWSLFQKGHRGGDRTWQLKLNNRIVGQGAVAGGSQDGGAIPLQAQLPEGGFFSGQLELAKDALGFDDVYYLAGRVPKGFRLLIVDGESGLAPSESEAYYLKLALESPQDPRLKSIHVIRPEALDQERLSDYDAVVLANVGSLGTAEAPLVKWVEQGGGVLVTAGGNWSKSPATPLHFFRCKPLRTHSGGVAKPDTSSPFLSAIAGLDSFQWNQLRVQKYRPLQTESSMETILSLDNGDPLLVRKQRGKGFVVCLTTTLDRHWTNLPAKPVFAPLMRELIASLADPLREQTSLNGYVDVPFRVRLPPGITNATVMAPDGTTGGASVDKEGYLEWPTPAAPGLYKVKTNKKDGDFHFAINIRQAAEESDLDRLAESQLKTIFPNMSARWVSYGSHTMASVLGALQGKDMTTLLIVLLFLLIITETILGWPRRTGLLAIGMVTVFLSVGSAGYGNKFVFAQLQHDGAWDPYPDVHKPVLQMVRQMTNIPFIPSRKVVTLSDADLFEYPFLILKGNSRIAFSLAEKKRLKQYIDKGGFLFIDDTLAESRGAFAKSIRSLMAELYPSRTFYKLSKDHALFRSFFLLRNVAGRRISERQLEGLDVGGQGGGEGRTSVIYCPNDLFGAWMKDPLGQYVYSCEPGGETQRWESFKLTINLIYFSLTGTYKRDAVHQPFIERKLGL